MERLVILCEVCLQPKIYLPEQEKYILGSYAVQCGVCKQISKIPPELKKDIKRRMGMFN